MKLLQSIPLYVWAYSTCNIRVILRRPTRGSSDLLITIIVKDALGTTRKLLILSPASLWLISGFRIYSRAGSFLTLSNITVVSDARRQKINRIILIKIFASFKILPSKESQISFHNNIF